MEQLSQLDHKLFLFLNNLGNPHWDWVWLAISDKWMAIPLYTLLLFLLYRKLGLKTTVFTLVIVALLIASTDQLANLFKHGFERLRPCGQEGVREYARFVAKRCGHYGFFSAHAANSAGVAVFLGLVFRRYYRNMIWFLAFWAVIVAYSRVYLGVHYPGDILVGMLIGSLLGYLFFRLYLFLLKKYEKKLTSSEAHKTT
ncbi:MAG: phosphatase PAP2 family protein [Salegentibacter sp.]